MKYNAFISYRHLPLDKFVAENLHKYLETYKLPKSLYGKCKNHTIERVFRDKDELPLISDLSEPIDAAIKASDFLIVICTPKLKESRWCLREIETFKAIHGREKIFAVLAQGEPDESFPEALLKDEYEEVDENGNTVKKTRFIEPLAADVRGKNNREIKKKIKEEGVRLLAPMFGLSYDDLKQRHRERLIKRRIMYASIIGSVVLLFGIVSTTMAVKIYSQNVEIKRNYAQSLANESEVCFAEGNLYEARSKAELAIEYANSEEALHSYDVAYGKMAAVGTHVLTDSFDIEDGVQGMIISPDGKYLAVADGIGQLWMLDVSNGDKEMLSGNVTTFANGYACFGMGNMLYYNTNDGLHCYDPDSKKAQQLNTGFSHVIATDDFTTIAVVSLSKVSFYDSASMECLSEAEVDVNSDCAADFSESGKTFAVTTLDPDITGGTVFVVNPNGGETKKACKYEGGAPVAIACKDDGYVLSLCDSTREGDTSVNMIESFDLDGTLKWKSEEESTMYAYVDYCKEDESMIFSYQIGQAMLFDGNKGDIVFKKPISGMLYSCQKMPSGNYALTLSDSRIFEFDANSESIRTLVNYDVMPTLRCSESILFDGTLYIHFAGTDYISVYRIPEGQMAETVSESADEFVANKPDDVVLFQNAIAEVYAYDETISRPESELASIMIHSKDCEYFACYGDGKSVRVYKKGDKKPMYSLPINTGLISYMLFSEDGGWFVASYQNGNLEIYDTASGEVVVSFEKDFPYVFDVVNIPELDSVVIDMAYETKILDGEFNERTTYSKTGDSMCIGYNIADNTLLIQTGDKVNAVPVR